VCLGYRKVLRTPRFMNELCAALLKVCCGSMLQMVKVLSLSCLYLYIFMYLSIYNSVCGYGRWWVGGCGSRSVRVNKFTLLSFVSLIFPFCCAVYCEWGTKKNSCFFNLSKKDLPVNRASNSVACQRSSAVIMEKFEKFKEYTKQQLLLNKQKQLLLRQSENLLPSRLRLQLIRGNKKFVLCISSH
jgi:hypothetical protein